MKELVLKALETFKPRPSDAWMLENDIFRARLAQQIMLFPSYALPTSMDASILCGIIHSFGAGEVWMVTGENFARDVRKILPRARWLLAHCFDELKLRRLEMMVVSGHAEGRRWAEHTGFEFECGPLRRKGPNGEDLDVFIFQQDRGEN